MKVEEVEGVKSVQKPRKNMRADGKVENIENPLMGKKEDYPSETDLLEREPIAPEDKMTKNQEIKTRKYQFERRTNRVENG